MQLVIDIKNESLTNKIISLLNIFKDDGVEILNYGTKKEVKKEQDALDHIGDDWREIVMGTHSADRDDDEYLYEAAWEFYSEKHSN